MTEDAKEPNQKKPFSWLKENKGKTAVLLIAALWLGYTNITGNCVTCFIPGFSTAIASPVAEGSTSDMPVWELPNVEGGTYKSTELEGKIAVVNFWATWCPPCREEIPHFIKIQEEMKDSVQFVGLSLDQAPKEMVADFAQKMKMNYPVVMANQETASKYGEIRGIPATFIYDAEGNLVKKHVGYMSEKQLKGFIAKAQPAAK